MKKQVFVKIFILTLVISSLIIPKSVFAFGDDDGYKTLSEMEAKKILTELPKALYLEWENLKSDPYSDPHKTTVVSFLRQAVNYDLWNYMFKDLPLGTSFKIGQSVVGLLGSLGTDAGGMSYLVDKFEKETVKAAVDYLKDYLFQNEIKVSFGALRVKYNTGNGKAEVALQYIMVYKEIDDKNGVLVTRIYSLNELVPPESHGSYGMSVGFLNELPAGQNIKPFIAEIKGNVQKTGFIMDYKWTSDPLINVSFPAQVPDFGLRPISFQDRYIINPLKDKVDEVIDTYNSFNYFFNSGAKIIDYVVNSNVDTEKVNEEIANMSQGQELNVENSASSSSQSNNSSSSNNSSQSNQAANQYEQILVLQQQQQQQNTEPKKPCEIPSNLSPNRKAIINEVAWMGTSVSANDEWIELKNIGNEAINLKGWNLIDKEKQINVVFDNLSINSNGYILLERTDDDTIPFKKADVIYTGALSNSNEALYLFDNNCVLQDFVEANPDWPAGDNTAKKTMEKGDDFSWHAYSGIGNQNIYGTPQESNSPKKEENQTINQINNIINTVVSAVSSSSGGGGFDFGFFGYCSQENLGQPSLTPIVINEVAWMGTSGSINDEWIELRNVTGSNVSLYGWQLVDEDKQIVITFTPGDIVPASGFYLFERTDDSSVPNVVANRFYVGALANSNESLRLFNDKCELIDEVVANPDWPAGDNATKKTMERNSDLSGWHTYALDTADPGSGLFGTPKTENSLVIVPDDNENQEDENNEDDEAGDEEGNNEGEEEENNEEETVEETIELVISEVQIDDAENHEYVELFNQSDKELNVCPDENNCFYLSYFSANRNFDNPYCNWKFPDNTIIAPKSHFLIDIHKEGGGDWLVKKDNDDPYGSAKLSDSTGSIAIFSSNPVYAGEEKKAKEEEIAYAEALKVDVASWKEENDDEEPLVRETNAFVINKEDNFGRKYDYEQGKYIDTDKNNEDFELQKPNPQSHPKAIPEKINDLIANDHADQKNAVVLSWSAPHDADTTADDLSYDIYYSRNASIDENNLKKIDDYTSVEIKKEENILSVEIKDLYFASDYYFTVIAKDKDDNSSPLSNVVAYTIAPAEHIKPMLYVDSFNSNNSKFVGPHDQDNFKKDIVVEGINDSDYMVNLVIDENNIIYFSGQVDGKKGFYAFKDKEKKWEVETPGAVYPALGKDGTIYFTTESSLYAFSPSGKQKWAEDLSTIYNQNLVIGKDDKLYLVALANPKLVEITDNQSSAETKNYSLGISKITNASKVMIDNNNNIYFTANNVLFAFDKDRKVTKRTIDPVYAGEDKKTKKEVDVSINRVCLSSQGTILFAASNGYVDKDKNATTLFYAFDKDKITEDPLWKEQGYSDPIGINDTEFYIVQLPPGEFLYHLKLVAVSISNGEIKWTKYWSGGSPPPSPSFITVDSTGHIYYVQGGVLYGYDPLKITDDKPETGKVFEAGEVGSGSLITIGDNELYITGLKKITKISY